MSHKFLEEDFYSEAGRGDTGFNESGGLVINGVESKINWGWVENCLDQVGFLTRREADEDDKREAYRFLLEKCRSHPSIPELARRLADLYSQGIGVAPSPDKALYWYEKSIVAGGPPNDFFEARKRLKEGFKEASE